MQSLNNASELSPPLSGVDKWKLLRYFVPINSSYINPAVVFVCLMLSLILSSCQQKTEKVISERKLTVVTTLFPLYDFARNIGKERANVMLLLPPGMEPHSYEPRPSDIAKIQQADIFIYAGRFMEPWIESILQGIGSEGQCVIDSSKLIMLSKEDGSTRKYGNAMMDPHIWLDFSNAQKMVVNILDGFLRKDLAHKDFYIKNAEEYKKRLDDLDKKFKDSLASCKQDSIIHGGHFVFGYLTRRYNIRYLSAYKGFSPDAEPTPKNLIELLKQMEEHHIKYVFYEELISPKVAEVIAKEAGAKLLMLNGAHNVTSDEMARGVTFISLMEQNLNNLRIGLECP